MPEVPAWLESLVEAVAGGLTAQGPPGPLGFRYLEEEGAWEVLVYPLPVEMVGGAHDGGVVSPGFSLDLEGLRSLFDRVDAFGWDAHGLAPDDGPSISMEGLYQGREVWLRVLAFAPDDEEPGMKWDTTGGR
jgi:hypothetical protein